MGKTIFLHEISPEDLQGMIRQAVREELNAFLSELKVQKDDADVLLSRAEACELLKVSLTTLWNWTKSNKVTAYSIIIAQLTSLNQMRNGSKILPTGPQLKPV